MNKGFIQIRRGLREHLALMSGNAVKLYLWLHLSANWAGPKRGCVEASYEDIARALGCSQKTLQRTIAELAPKYIEVAHVNQFKPTTVRIIKYDTAVDDFVQGDPAAMDTAVDKSVLSDVHSNPAKPQTAHDLRASKNAIEGIEEKKKETPAAKLAPPPDPRYQEFFKFCYESFRMKFLQPPASWNGEGHHKSLRDFLRSNPNVALEEWKRRYMAFLASTDRFYQQQHGSLQFFVSKFDHFISGPVQERKANGKLDANEVVAITMQAAARNARRPD